jgi:hypothetical protein
VTDSTWKPLFRSPRATITKVLRSPAFADSRDRSAVIITDPEALRALAGTVESLDHTRPPLSTVADRVGAAVRFLRAKADRLDRGDDSLPGAEAAAAGAARERLVVAALHYLVTPVDLVPDFRVGGYLDDVLLLGWVFGAAASELEPFLPDYLDDPEI